MCGIAGILNFNGAPVQTDDLRAMTSRMIHRGPDDDGFYSGGPVGLGMRRLAIIDIGGGHQPIANEDQSVWVVMNGEIYNFIELRRDLKARGHVFRTDSDTEVIVHLYEEKGIRAIDDLNGMFGFALWDERRRALWIARDRLGIKPLYYVESAERLAFASDLSALRGAAELRVSREAVLQYLALAYVPSPNTIYHEAKKLPAGHYLWVENRRIERRRYWNLPPRATWNGGAAEAAERLRALLEDAVKLQLRSDVPLALLLSGGVDSSTIVALAAEQSLGVKLRALTVDFVAKGSSDAKFARLVASRHNVEYCESRVDATSALAALDEMMSRIDEPIGDSAAMPSYLLARAARNAGIKVLLSGAGGDEIFGGYARYWPARVGSPSWIADHFPGPVRRAVGKVWQRWNPDRGARAGDPAFALGAGISGVSLSACAVLLRSRHDYIAVEETLRRQFGGLRSAERRYGRAYARMASDLEGYLVEDVLAINDKTTMAASIEGRVPLLDHRLVEFALGLPPGLNFRGRPKGLLRHVMARDLPPELLNRSKDGFNAPIPSWLQRGGNVDIAGELGEQAVPIVQDLIDPIALRRLLADPRLRCSASHTLYSLYLFNRWHRAHFRPQ